MSPTCMPISDSYKINGDMITGRVEQNIVKLFMIEKYHQHVDQTYRDDKVGMNIKVWIKNNTSHFGEEFMSDQQDIRNGGKSESMLHGLLQYYSKLTEKKKNRRLKDPLDHIVSTNNETRATRSQNRRCNGLLCITRN